MRLEPCLTVRQATMRRIRAPHDERRPIQACGGRPACRQLRATGHLTSICTETTFYVIDRLIRAAKVRAGEEGDAPTRLTERASRQYLAMPVSTVRPFPAKLVIKGRQPVASVNVDDRDALHERMDGRG